jgi:taurine transport system substrate-binding protein
MKKIISLLLAVVLSLSVLAFTGCGSDSSEKATVVNIATMNLVNGDLIAQYENYYEDELGVKVKLVNFDSGKDVNAAIASGSIDIAELGSAPTANGLSSNLDYEVFWVGDILGSAESLAVKNSLKAKDITDLKGKKIATPFASTSHYSLLNALKLAGVSEDEVTLLDLEPDDIYASWQRGDIDAAYVWYPVLGQLLEDGTTLTDSGKLADQGVVTGDLNIVRTDFAKSNPDVVTNYVKAQIKANDILNNDKEKAAKEVASVLEIEEDDAAEQITQYKYLTADEQIDFLNNELASTLKQTADFLVDQKSITSALDESEFQNKITTEFIEAAIK